MTPATRSKSSLSLWKPGNFQILDGEENVPFPEDGYHGDDIRELAKIFYEQHGDSYRKCIPEGAS